MSNVRFDADFPICYLTPISARRPSALWCDPYCGRRQAVVRFRRRLAAVQGATLVTGWASAPQWQLVLLLV
jgi:hypothetical protein